LHELQKIHYAPGEHPGCQHATLNKQLRAVQHSSWPVKAQARWRILGTMDDPRRVGLGGTPPPSGCASCYTYGVICALVGASLQAVGLQVRLLAFLHLHFLYVVPELPFFARASLRACVRAPPPASFPPILIKSGSCGSSTFCNRTRRQRPMPRLSKGLRLPGAHPRRNRCQGALIREDKYGRTMSIKWRDQTVECRPRKLLLLIGPMWAATRQMALHPRTVFPQSSVILDRSAMARTIPSLISL
jgi:hypothetical protein